MSWSIQVVPLGGLFAVHVVVPVANTIYLVEQCLRGTVHGYAAAKVVANMEHLTAKVDVCIVTVCFALARKFDANLTYNFAHPFSLCESIDIELICVNHCGRLTLRTLIVSNRQRVFIQCQNDEVTMNDCWGEGGE